MIIRPAEKYSFPLILNFSAFSAFLGSTADEDEDEEANEAGPVRLVLDPPPPPRPCPDEEEAGGGDFLAPSFFEEAPTGEVGFIWP